MGPQLPFPQGQAFQLEDIQHLSGDQVLVRRALDIRILLKRGLSQLSASPSHRVREHLPSRFLQQDLRSLRAVQGSAFPLWLLLRSRHLCSISEVDFLVPYLALRDISRFSRLEQSPEFDDYYLRGI